MEVFTVYLFGVIILGLIGSIFVIIKKGVSGLKIMLLGINITLFGVIIALVYSNANFDGIKYIIAFIGLILSVIGLGKQD